MARFIGYEGARRFADYIEKLTGDDEIVPPGYIIEADPPENKYLKRVRLWSSRATIAAAAANNGRMQLTNPAQPGAPGPGVIVVVQGIGQVNSLSNNLVRVTGDAAAAGGGISPANGLDTRISLDQTGVLAVQPPQNTVSNANAIISGFFVDQFRLLQALGNGYSPVVAAEGFILTPGHNLTIFDETVNESATFVAWGYSRPARAEELAL